MAPEVISKVRRWLSSKLSSACGVFVKMWNIIPAKWFFKNVLVPGLLVGIAILLILPLLEYSVDMIQKDFEDNLQIYAYLDVDDAKGRRVLRARVFHDDGVPRQVNLWAVLKGRSGQKQVLDFTYDSGPNGSFTIANVPERLGEETVNEIIIRAALEQRGQETLKGQATLSLAPNKTLKIPVWWVTPIALVFLTSLLVGFIRPSKDWQYTGAMFLTVIFTAAMIVVISAFLENLKENYDEDDILTLGPVVIFKGSYVQDVEDEWLFSFTSPAGSTSGKRKGGGTSSTPISEASDQKSEQAPSPTDRNQRDLVKGFGAPLWVLFIAVLGAAIITVAMIVDEIRHPPKSGNTKQIDLRIEKFARHQFYIAFAPLGGIVIYQILVGADAADKHLTVVLAALGAGVSLNKLLNWAVQYAQGLFRPR